MTGCALKSGIATAPAVVTKFFISSSFPRPLISKTPPIIPTITTAIPTIAIVEPDPEEVSSSITSTSYFVASSGNASPSSE